MGFLYGRAGRLRSQNGGFRPGQRNIYTIYGDAISPLEMPPAFQIEGAFGANTGGVNPLFFNALSTAKYDSWLSVGLTEGDDQNDIGSIGIDFGTWTATAPLSTK